MKYPQAGRTMCNRLCASSLCRSTQRPLFEFTIYPLTRTHSRVIIMNRRQLPRSKLTFNLFENCRLRKLGIEIYG